MRFPWSGWVLLVAAAGVGFGWAHVFVRVSEGLAVMMSGPMLAVLGIVRPARMASLGRAVAGGGAIVAEPM